MEVHNRTERQSEKISLPEKSDGKKIGKGGRRKNGQSPPTQAVVDAGNVSTLSRECNVERSEWQSVRHPSGSRRSTSLTGEDGRDERDY
jgi:hypothetical protein